MALTQFEIALLTSRLDDIDDYRRARHIPAEFLSRVSELMRTWPDEFGLAARIDYKRAIGRHRYQRRYATVGRKRFHVK